MICQSVILAAGLSTRMKSRIPKVLHLLGGKPLLWWAIQPVKDATQREPTIVIGPDSDDIRDAIGDEFTFVEQIERLGTGHALLQTKDQLEGSSELVLVTSADMPLFRSETLISLIRVQDDHKGPMSLLIAKPSRSRGFGRILRNEGGGIVEIVEEALANEGQLALKEVNVGAYCFQSDWLWEHLTRLPLSAKGEYYLTDLVGLATAEGSTVAWVEVDDEDEIIGINTREHLAEAHAALRRRINRQWMLAGVTIVDPSSTYIDPDVSIGMDTTVHPNTYLEGNTVIGEGCVLGPNSIIRNAAMGDRCHVLMSVMEGATLEDEVLIGPFARLRKGAYLCHGVHMGNFGEVKNSTLKPGVKLGHFSYIGDATIGENTNIGAGTITCNFDGVRKNHTEIGEDVFIGSDTMLVAPLSVGKGARTGAGSVVTKDVPENTLVAGIPARAIRKLDQGE
ncbi:MAG: UDP-N-acetylglucosamine diphosphorylase/glucosamine-1-phosphate N-acetyltransferase [Anaerolineales bacterium]|nr:UDP-N-acetylglucosamine diphosphorylase/glucosamine-1-phosphate N-acetyltransferase [Anaerolineales bacterium]